MALALDVTDAPRSYNISATAHGLYNVINPEPCKGSHSDPVTTQARIGTLVKVLSAGSMLSVSV